MTYNLENIAFNGDMTKSVNVNGHMFKIIFEKNLRALI